MKNLEVLGVNTKGLKQVDVVFGSMDYKALPMLKNYNRAVQEYNIKQLVTSMMIYGFVGTGIVIETSAFDGVPTRYIADMQHRIIAAERLGLPINYIVYKLKNDTQKEVCEFISELNSNSKTWSTKNYLDSFSYLGLEPYIIMKEAQRETGLTVTDLQQMFLFGRGTAQKKAFESGNMKFPNLNKSLKLKDALMKVKPYLPNKAYCRRGLFDVLALCDGKYDKMANAIIKAYNNSIAACYPIPEEEKPLKAWLLNVYQNTFDC